MEEYKILQTQILEEENQLKKTKKQIEDRQTEKLLANIQIELLNKKAEKYEKDEEYKNQTLDTVQESIKQKKQQIKDFQKKEEELQTQLLPYLKFRTASNNIKPTQFYDMIIHCSSISSLLEKGWRIQFNRKFTKINEETGNNNLQQLIDKFNTSSYQIGIIGDSNKGKSYFLFLLCEERFKKEEIKVPAGMAIQTKGLSVIKFEFERGRWADLLDSEGFHTAIQYELNENKNIVDEMQRIQQQIAQLEEEKKSQQNEEDKKRMEDRLNELNQQQQQQQQQIRTLDENTRQKLFNDRQLSEKLTQNYILKSSSMIIIMVGDLSINEQITVEQITAMQESKPIIVVHNMFKVSTLEELLRKTEQNLDQSFQVQEQTYVNGLKYYIGIQRVQNTVKYREIFHVSFGYHATEELLQAIKDIKPQEFDELTRIKEYNYQVLQFLKDKINFYYTKLSSLSKRSLISSVKDFFQDNITDYLDINMDINHENYQRISRLLNQLNFDLRKIGKKEQLLYSNQLFEYHNFLNLKNFKFDVNNQIIKEPNQQIIYPQYTTQIIQIDNRKYIIVNIEMPPVSNKDKDEIMRCLSIKKDNDFYILQLRNYRRKKDGLFNLFDIKNFSNLESIAQNRDTKRIYKEDGRVEIDIQLCQLRSYKVHNVIDPNNVIVADGVVKCKIECEDFQQENQQNDYFDDEGEEYLN